MTPWMDRAWSHIGLRETPGPAATADIVAMYAKAGHAEVRSDEVPWCAAFVGACLADAGLPGTGSLLARSYLEYGTACELKPGAVAVFRRGSDPAAGHVAFVTGWGDGKVRVLGGNQGNAVSEASYSLDALLATRWPPVKVAVAPGPLPRSGTLWGSAGAALSGVLVWLEEGVRGLLEVVAQLQALEPAKLALATVGGNTRALALGLLAGSVALVVGRRLKAGQEGKAG